MTECSRVWCDDRLKEKSHPVTVNPIFCLIMYCFDFGVFFFYMFLFVLKYPINFIYIFKLHPEKRGQHVASFLEDFVIINM